MGFIKRWLIKRALKKASTKSDMEKIADDVLGDALKELRQTSSTADKILKAKLIRQESSHALKKISELDEELEEEEELETPSMEDTITNALINKLLGGGLGTTPPAQQTENITGYDEKGNPIPTPTPQPQAPTPSGLPTMEEAAAKLTPKQIEEIKQKYFK